MAEPTRPVSDAAHHSPGLAVIERLVASSHPGDTSAPRGADVDEARKIVEAVARLETVSGGESVVGVIDQIARSASAASTADEAGLTAEQEAVLRRAGSFVDRMPLLSNRQSTATQIRRAADVTRGLTTREAAELLGVGESRIRQRVAARTLFAVQTGQGVRFPRFQFVSDGALPGWDEVAPRFPADAHPVAVSNFMQTPTVELEIGGEPTSPRDWLIGGGMPSRVIELVDAAYQLP